MNQNELTWQHAVTASTAAKLLHLSKEEFEAYVDKGAIPVHYKHVSQVGRRGFATRRFLLADIAQILDVAKIIGSARGAHKVIAK